MRPESSCLDLNAVSSLSHNVDDSYTLWYSSSGPHLTAKFGLPSLCRRRPVNGAQVCDKTPMVPPYRPEQLPGATLIQSDICDSRSPVIEVKSGSVMRGPGEWGRIFYRVYSRHCQHHHTFYQ